jgi:hypothetical protein
MDYAEMYREIDNTPTGTGRDITLRTVLKGDGEVSALSLYRFQILLRVHRLRVASLEELEEPVESRS